MANEGHLSLLGQGAEAWNRWRQQRRKTIPDLFQANLQGRDFRKFDLSDAHLAGANLVKANLREADLRRASIEAVSLEGANLSGAKLIHAKIEGTYLNGSNLRGANLSLVHFRKCHFTNADFTTAVLNQTTFADTDLSEAEGLKDVFHFGPSTIGIDTIFRSNGKIPERFLRGCGVPDIFIEYATSLIGKPIDFYSCFISYSTKDQDFAQRLHADLQANGVRCWFAPEDLKIGDKFRVTIDETIRIHDKLLLVLSEPSVHSGWVEKEVETAVEKEREQSRTMLFPIRLDDAVMELKTGWPADIRRARHIGDFRNWKNHDAYQKAFNRLLRDLKAPGGNAAA